MADLHLQIRATLRPFKEPKNQDNDYLIAKRLGEAHKFILQVKTSYPNELNLCKMDVWGKDYTSMPLWMDRITPILQLYLDTYIIRNKFLPPDRVEPIACYEVYGTEEQVYLIKHYIGYLYGSIKAFHALYQERLAKIAKVNRRNARKAGERYKAEDIRLESSKYRKRLISSIVSKLNNILEEAKMNEKHAFYKGLAHQERIDKYMKAKYNPQWRQS